MFTVTKFSQFVSCQWNFGGHIASFHFVLSLSLPVQVGVILPIYLFFFKVCSSPTNLIGDLFHQTKAIVVNSFEINPALLELLLRENSLKILVY